MRLTHYRLVRRCSMALVHSRIRRVFYGCLNVFAGGLGSQYKIHTQQGINHHFEVFSRVLEHQCKELEIWICHYLYVKFKDFAIKKFPTQHKAIGAVERKGSCLRAPPGRSPDVARFKVHGSWPARAPSHACAQCASKEFHQCLALNCRIFVVVYTAEGGTTELQSESACSSSLWIKMSKVQVSVTYW